MKHNIWPSLFAFLIAAILIFARLGQLPLMQPDEGRNAEVAREMKDSGAWLIPTYNGLPYLDKPSFYFKTVALSFALFGETEAAARLSSAMFGFALLVMTFAFCRRVYSERTAALAVVVVATAPLYLAFSRLVIFDMTLTFFICGAVFAGYIAEQKQGRARAGWYLLGSASAAVATLVKGPVGFILPTMVLGIFNLLDKNRGALKRFFAPLNLVVFSAITLPWFLGVNHLHPDFAYYGIIEESFHRYTTAQFRRTGPLYYYVPWIAAGLFPWSVLLPEAAVAAWHARKRWMNADRLFIVWAATAVVFFSISKSKRPDYILSVVVALGALVGRMFASALQDRNGLAARVVRHSAAVLAVLGVLGAGCLAVAAFYPHALERSLKVEAGELDRVTALCGRLTVGLLLAAVVAGIARWRGDVRALFAAFGLFPLALLTAGFDGIRLYANAKSSRTLTDRLPTLQARTEIACLECFPTGLPFYRKELVTVLTEDGDELTSNYIVFMLKKTKLWPPGAVSMEERDLWLASRDHPVLMLAQRNAVDDLKSIAVSRSVPVTEFGLGWWGALLPTPGGP